MNEHAKLSVKERMLIYADSKNCSHTSLYSRMVVSKATFNRRNIKQDIRTTFIEAFYRIFPSVSLEWLLFGTGPMDAMPDQHLPIVTDLYQNALAQKDELISILKDRCDERDQRIKELQDLVRLLKEKEKGKKR